MYKIIALMGKAGTGKDTIAKKLQGRIPKANFIVSYTTRPKREGEVDGITYHYITEKEFLSADFFDKENFNNWYYGTGYQCLKEDCVNIGIFNPNGIRTLLRQPNIDVSVYEILVSDKERLLRQLNRENNPNVKEIVRRFQTDEKDFEDLEFDRITLQNEASEDLERACALIEGNLG